MRSIRIFGTFGPSCHTKEVLEPMVAAGMNGIRLNTNHKPVFEAGSWIENFKSACKASQITGEILIDLHGRALRTGQLDSPLHFEPGDLVALEDLHLESDILNQLRIGDEILFDDGKVKAKLTGSRTLEILFGSVLDSHKNMSVSNRRLRRSVLSEFDQKQLLAAKQYGVSSIMVPFVQSRKDLEIVHAFLDRHQLDFRIYAKIENQKGVDHLEEIMELADEIVIARGDLANHVGLLMIGKVSQKIIEICHAHNKPYMIVTQMLHSMIDHPQCTRAEVLDVFQAVYYGASSIMLTNETAAGSYPIEAMEAFCTIAKSAL